VKTPKPNDLIMFRKIYGLTQYAAARLVGQGERSWRGYELGEHRMPAGLWMLARVRAIELRRQADRRREMSVPVSASPVAECVGAVEVP